MSSVTERFPQGVGGSPCVWTPSTEPLPLRSVTAGDWIRVDVSYRASNTMPVVSCLSASGSTGGLFQVHVVYTVNADDSIPQTDGGRIQPTLYGGSATKLKSSYHIDPGWGFQAPWDGQISIVSGGNSDPSVQCDVIMRVGSQLQPLSTAPHLQETLLHGLTMSQRPKPQRVFAPPVIGHPEIVPATYVFIPPGSTTNLMFPRTGVATISLPSGATGIQMTDAENNANVNTITSTITSMGVVTTLAFLNGSIEQIGSLGQGGGASDSAPAIFSPVTSTSVSTIYKVVVWSKLTN